MIVDSSALVAILLRQPGYEAPLGHLATADVVGVGTPTLAETGIVLEARAGTPARSLLARFIHEARLVPVPFGEEHWRAAIDAFIRYGKGRHPAALNFGDCLTYATARLADEPLLCIGDDFARTDLPLVA